MKKSAVTFLFAMVFGLSGFQCEDNVPREVVDETCIDRSKINPDAACYMIYKPVCGCNGVTYSNDCIARNNGVVKFTEGECD
ncbi:Kazal-type serine protease inhibitor domain-containing protein [Mongoliibacter ruber]|uniref:Kazal-type serine protease inhibitor-like protein n=1 Tax=Mongoliibacter ruber TaxID=1750599 RepID=A0A2T0WSC8_9BACT|nr:Kazal-type serine protease inhibitor domain-containing protein [Mongoliibacter ruber]PRY89601.1 Kazal-type serine protease inhibitor-like protein [Mongoliibacter ruber]